MNYLLIDDQPEFLKNWKRELEINGNTVTIVRDLTSAWNLLLGGKRYDLVVIDILLDRRETEFSADFHALQPSLAARDKGGAPMSGQALGLRLWHERKSLQQAYCYLTHDAYLWLEGQNAPDIEFARFGSSGSPDLIIEKTEVFAHNVAQKFAAAQKIWSDEKWLL